MSEHEDDLKAAYRAQVEGLHTLAEKILELSCRASVILEDEDTALSVRVTEAQPCLEEAREWLDESGWLPHRNSKGAS